MFGDPVGDADLTWQALAELHPQTGLVPIGLVQRVSYVLHAGGHMDRGRNDA